MAWLLLLLLLPATTWAACFLPKTSPWYWNRDQLVARSRNIFMVKRIAAKPASAKGRWAYRFKVLETVKGDPKDEASLDDMTSPYRGAGIQTGARSRHDDQCHIDVGFEEGKTYLIFKGLHKGIFNPMAFQEVSGAEDPWLVEVKSKIRK
jgi:hypothetical protein